MILTEERMEGATELIKTNRDGRVRYTAEQKQKVLDLFEQSGLSGKAFTEKHGIKYSTFAMWRRQRSEAQQSGEASQGGDEGFVLAEISSSQSENSGLTLVLPGGSEVQAQGPDGVDLLAQLITRLS